MSEQRRCDIPCDDDCEAGCHQLHLPRHKRHPSACHCGYQQRVADAAMQAWNERALVCEHAQRVPIGELVDAVLGVPNPELERLREENAKLLYAADPARVEAAARLVNGLTRAARTQRDDARAALARVRELHVRHEFNGVAWCTHCSENDYPNYQTPWPCPTIRAIEGTA